jgi:hypothetical protein
VLAIAFTFAAGSLRLAAAPPTRLVTIDVPGAVVTVASGINNDGVVVGWYCVQTPCNGAGTAANPATPANPRTRGFLRNPDGSFVLLNANDCAGPDAPDPCHPAISTQPRYISPQGVVIGAYITLENGATFTNPRFRGFSWYQGRFSYFDAPDDLYDHISSPGGPAIPHSIIPRGINADGDIVGCIHDIDQMDSMHGFRLHLGNFTRDPDGMTMHNGINASGDVVGLDNASPTAYRLDRLDNVVERFAYPGAASTAAWGINARGDIVGQYFGSDAVSHGFMRDKNGEYTAFAEPTGVLGSAVFGIADDGSVVGQYRNAAGTHGFVLLRGAD